MNMVKYDVCEWTHLLKKFCFTFGAFFLVCIWWLVLMAWFNIIVVCIIVILLFGSMDLFNIVLQNWASSFLWCD
jgi:hypothetical protein